MYESFFAILLLNLIDFNFGLSFHTNVSYFKLQAPTYLKYEIDLPQVNL